jgi:Ankyrin repeats (many copies)
LVTKMVNSMTRESHGRAASAAKSSFSRERESAISKRLNPAASSETYFPPEHRGPQSQQYTATSQRQSDDLVCDYDQNVTPLYELLESSQWDQARLKSRTHPEQVQTWIVRRDEQRNIKWKLLPLHAAVIFQAPVIVIEALLQEYSVAVQQRDDQGMLPLHLAFRHSLDDSLLELLLQLYPQGISVQDKRGRIPLDHAGDRVFSSAFVNVYSRVSQNNSLIRSPSAMATPDTTTTRAHYENIIASLHHEHEQSLLRMQQTMEEEQESIRVHHQQELKELRDRLSRRDVHSGGAYHHLQDALQRVSADNQTLRSRLQAQETHYEDLLSQMKIILQDQMTLKAHCEKQQLDLAHAQKMRDEMLKSLSAQKDTSSSARQISKLSESIRLRTEALLLRPELAIASKVARAMPSPTGASASAKNALRSVEDASNGEEGDDVSAITDENYHY